MGEFGMDAALLILSLQLGRMVTGRMLMHNRSIQEHCCVTPYPTACHLTRANIGHLQILVGLLYRVMGSV